MEKLRFLLNEFEPYICKDGEHRDNLWYSVICGESAIFTKEIGVQKIISKEYKFIQWLLKEKKIDLYNLLKENGKFRKEFYDIENRKDDERLIMLLSIQEDAIGFLISILK